MVAAYGTRASALPKSGRSRTKKLPGAWKLRLGGGQPGGMAMKLSYITGTDQ
ncbi:hypothetical protein GCM10010341_15530 [Streptomyces noursei]|nr:hypothetical protein GCM10010341_15530 [Streptomyces noursei]